MTLKFDPLTRTKPAAWQSQTHIIVIIGSSSSSNFCYRKFVFSLLYNEILTFTCIGRPELKAISLPTLVQTSLP